MVYRQGGVRESWMVDNASRWEFKRQDRVFTCGVEVLKGVTNLLWSVVYAELSCGLVIGGWDTEPMLAVIGRCAVITCISLSVAAPE
jgi:hypothetical protein